MFTNKKPIKFNNSFTGESFVNRGGLNQEPTLRPKPPQKLILNTKNQNEVSHAI